MKIIFSKITWSVLIFLMIASLTLISCSGASTSTASLQNSNVASSAGSTLTAEATITPKSGGILRVVPRSFSQVFGYPGDMVYPGAADIASSCIESLCGVTTGNAFIPKLATSAEFSLDGKSITFGLRKGVKFHDGTDFNAQAAKWNLDISKKVRLSGADRWTSIEVVDDYTLRINLKGYYNAILTDLATTSAKISSPAAFEKYGESEIHLHPVGTGPFKFVSYAADEKVTYERYDDYWGGKPYLDGIEVFLIKDDMAKSAALQSGGVDILFNIDPETGVALRGKGYYVATGSQDQIVTIIPDSANADSPLSNIKVRQAIDYAIDKNSLKDLGNGFWLATNQLSTPNTPGFIPNFEGRPYNPEKAKQLLSEAGYPNGFKMSLVFNPVGSTPQDTMVAVQQFLSKVGITVELQSVTSQQKSDTHMNGWKNGWIVTQTYAGLAYISALQRNLEPTGTVMYVCTTRPPGWAEALNQASMANDPANFERLSRNLVQMLYDDVTVLPLWGMPQNLFAAQTYVHGAGIYETGANYAWSPETTWLSK